MDLEKIFRFEEKRGEIYKLLSRCYYLPGEHTSAQVAELIQVMSDVYPEVAEQSMYMSDEIDIEQLKIDFSKLFVGPFNLLAPPYGSVYLEPARRIMGDTTLDVQKRYKEAGLNFSDKIKEAPDHIAIELEFMYYLIFKEIETMPSFDEDVITASRMEQHRFLEDHLGAWVPAFTEKVEKYAATDFYKNLAGITKEFILKEKAEISKVLFTVPTPG